MKETILDVLMFMFQSYVEDNEEVELDKESLHKNLSEAGFADKNIERLLWGKCIHIHAWYYCPLQLELFGNDQYFNTTVER